MSRKILSLENLKDLEMGIVQEAFQHEMTRIVGDVKDRPDDDHARKVSINFLIKPADSRGDAAYVECEVIGSVPKRVSRPYEMRVQGDMLTFEPLSPDDPDQMDIEEEIERSAKERKSE